MRPPRPEKSAIDLYSCHISESDIVVEAGANMGIGTQILSDLSAKVYAFEPNPYSFRLLKHFARNAKNVVLFNTALGDHLGQAWLHLGYDASLSSAADSLKKMSGVRYTNAVKVSMTTIDSNNLNPAPTCFVLDCEGSEVEVLLGGEKRISSKLVKTILVETHILQDGSSTLADVKNLLSKYYYEMSEYVDSDGIPWVIAHQPKISITDSAQA